MAYNRNQKHKNHSSTNQRDERPRRHFTKKLGRHEFYLEGNPNGVKVPDPSIGTLERSLKYLKRQMKDSGILMKYRNKKEYIKPSMKRRIQKEEAIRSEQYKNRMEGRREKGYIWTAIVDGKAV